MHSSTRNEIAVCPTLGRSNASNHNQRGANRNLIAGTRMHILLLNIFHFMCEADTKRCAEEILVSNLKLFQAAGWSATSTRDGIFIAV